MERLSALLFELSNEDRLRILLQLKERPLKLSSLAQARLHGAGDIAERVTAQYEAFDSKRTQRSVPADTLWRTSVTAVTGIRVSLQTSRVLHDTHAVSAASRVCRSHRRLSELHIYGRCHVNIL